MRVTPNYFIIMFVEFSHMEKKDFPRVILSNILEAFHLQGLCLMLGISALLITCPGRCVNFTEKHKHICTDRQIFKEGLLQGEP